MDEPVVQGMSIVANMSLVSGRFDVVLHGNGACVGASPSNGFGLSEVGEITINDSELICRDLFSRGPGGGSEIPHSSFITRVRQVIVRNSTISCHALSRASDERDSCVNADGIVLAVNITGRTNTLLFFNASTITFQSSPLVAVRYLSESDEEGLTNFPSLHLREINPGFSGRYAVSPSSWGSMFVEMTGAEKGLLLSTDPGTTLLAFWRLPQGVLGKIVGSDEGDIVISGNETIVDRPGFLWATMQFTSLLSPYRCPRAIFIMRRYVLMLCMANVI
jgi:hypothetical protein